MRDRFNCAMAATINAVAGVAVSVSGQREPALLTYDRQLGGGLIPEPRRGLPSQGRPAMRLDDHRRGIVRFVPPRLMASFRGCPMKLLRKTITIS